LLTNNVQAAEIQVSIKVFYVSLVGIFVAVTAYRPLVQPSASHGFKKAGTAQTIAVQEAAGWAA
jgi:hypothetical protein